MKFLWFSWKDIHHPEAGGAEKVMHELSKRLLREGHEVTVLTARYTGASRQDEIDGVKIIRIGKSRYLHSFQALLYYLFHLRHRFDVVVEVVNTAPYFGIFFKGKAKAVLLYHQLAREIWFLEASFPLNYLGYYLLEPGATKLLAASHASVVTVSNSTKQDLLRYGFNSQNVHIISEGTHIAPVESLKVANSAKFELPTVLSFGALRSMKRTLDQVKAFEVAKATIPELQMKIAGNDKGAYGTQVKAYIQKSRFKESIEVLGRVSDEQKLELMRKASCIVVTSIKEGWGLIVTEANSQGTPAIVYNVDGLRDAVKDGISGRVTASTPEALAAGMCEVLQDENQYKALQAGAYEMSKAITFEQSYQDLKKVLELA
ncbi:MAG TPA: glycosyltransferase family 4 protein [Candidatus Saccharimonadales bacterium]